MGISNADTDNIQTEGNYADPGGLPAGGREGIDTGELEQLPVRPQPYGRRQVALCAQQLSANSIRVEALAALEAKLAGIDVGLQQLTYALR